MRGCGKPGEETIETAPGHTCVSCSLSCESSGSRFGRELMMQLMIGSRGERDSRVHDGWCVEEE